MSAPEEWRPIPGYEGLYEVSDLGRVRSVDRVVARSNGTTLRLKGQLLRPGRASNGYLTVALQGWSHPVQHLVAAAFIGPRPPGMHVLHGDGSRTNNVVGNLRCGTPAENAADKGLHGRTLRGSANGGKLSDEQVRQVRSLAERVPKSVLARRFGVSLSCIYFVCQLRTYRHV